ncbi:hypothetical protein K438DRAFT_2020331 [Mycena galopus ATCC 62051]|nr:hypothetical protein K438DRAFT_2020331 [Mycena galopus ATCC 62051]
MCPHFPVRSSKLKIASAALSKPRPFVGSIVGEAMEGARTRGFRAHCRRNTRWRPAVDTGQTARIVGGIPDGGLGCPLSRWTQWRGLQGGKSAKTINTTMHEFYHRVSDTATGVEVSRPASNVIFLPIDSD